MGVRGLTTFINSNAHIFFVDFKLQNCTLVIDGNSLAAVLYCENLGPYSAFGGDYDQIGEHVEKFINSLKKCKVEAIFIFDGGYEAKKATTVRKRNALKVFSIDKITPDKSSRDFFPYMLRPVLQEKLIELGVTCLQSDHEADREIAAIAKKLGAPVLSNDSDFFIFDVPFIQLARFSFNVCQNDSTTKITKHYIPCEIYYIEHFLKSFGGLDKNMLPLLATVLGNDYLNRSVFKNLFGLIKLDKSKKMTLGQRRVCGLVKWLKKETFDTALKKILSSLPKNRRQRVKNNIKSIISGYSKVDTCLECYLPEHLTTDKSTVDISYENICTQLKQLDIRDESKNIIETIMESEENLVLQENSSLEDIVDDGGDDNGDDGGEDSNEEISENESPEANKPEIPQWLLDRHRKCQISPHIMTLFTLNTYFCVPQVEDCNLPHAGEIGLPILQIIAGIIFGKNASITYWHRQGSNFYKRETLSISNTYKNGVLPKLSSLNKISLESRKILLLEVLKIEDSFVSNLFPVDWQLLFLCLIYWIKSNDQLKPYHIHAVIIMIIVINIYFPKIGVFRKLKLFIKKYGAKVKSLENERATTIAKLSINRKCSIIQELSQVTIDDCLVTFEALQPNLNIDPIFKERPRTFQRSIIHTYAELQTIFDLTQTLNSLLLQPYERIRISKFYNGTFLYNITACLKRQLDIIGYLEKLFKKAPTLFNLHMCIFYELEKFINSANIVVPPKVVNNKRRRKRKKEVVNKNSEVDEISDEGECFQDQNNKFSLLQCTNKL